MFLTGEQRDQFFKDLASMKPTDFSTNVSVGTGSGTPPIPTTGFPPVPPTGLGYGAMGAPGTPMTGTPMTPSHPSHPPGYVPSFVAPANLPVLPKSTPP